MEADEYFSVQSAISINIATLPRDFVLPDDTQFQQSIPTLFRVCSECQQIEEQAEHDIARAGSEPSQALLRYIQAQNTRINILMGYLLAQHDTSAERLLTDSFGAGSLSITTSLKDGFQLGQYAELRIYLDNPTAAIFCYAQVVDITPVDSADNAVYRVRLQYCRLLESDRDLLIKAALQAQQKILRLRAEARNNPIK